jgi:hypothetical protein
MPAKKKAKATKATRKQQDMNDCISKIQHIIAGMLAQTKELRKSIDDVEQALDVEDAKFDDAVQAAANEIIRKIDDDYSNPGDPDVDPDDPVKGGDL